MKYLVSLIDFIFRPILALKNYPILIKVGNFYIASVGIINAVSACAALLCATYYFTAIFSDKGSSSYFMVRVFIVIMFSLIFSKLFHYFALGPQFFKNPRKHLAETAYYDQGGQIGVFFGTIWFAYDTQINFFACMDIIATAGYLAFAIGRIGCYNYGCCHGRPIKNRFATIYTNPDSKALRIFPELANIPLAPTQLISAVFSFALFCTMALILTLSPRAGFVSAYSIVVYNIFRLYIERYRMSVINPSEKITRAGFFSKVAAFILSCGILYVAYVMWYHPARLKFATPMSLTEFFVNDVFQTTSIVLLMLICVIYFVTWGIHYKKLGQHFEWKGS